MIHRWDIVTIGNLSRNRYWGEGDATPVRPALCTCTFIDGHGFRLLVDPSLADRQKMEAELERRTGLQLHEVERDLRHARPRGPSCGVGAFRRRGVAGSAGGGGGNQQDGHVLQAGDAGGGADHGWDRRGFHARSYG